MDADTLRTAGEALFGPHWIESMSESIDVAPRTIRRWLGGWEIPAGIRSELIMLAHEKEIDLRDLLQALEARSP